MNNGERENLRQAFKEQFGFLPPCNLGAAGLGSEMEDIITQYHHLVWEEGVIPLKYRYLMALATAVYGEDDTRAKLELLKAVRHGATREEVVEVLRQQVWMRGAPLIIKISPLLKFLAAIENSSQNITEE